VCSCGNPGIEAIWNFNGQPTVMMIKDQKKKESSGPYSTCVFGSAGVHVTMQKA